MPKGIIGLVLAIIFCVEIAVSPAGLLSVFFGVALGLASLVASIAGIAKRSGRAAGLCGILVFGVGCLMMFTTVLDVMAAIKQAP
jgi:hypothetical protein